MRHTGVRFILSLSLLALVGAGAAFAPTPVSDVTVHEWGTFTTVAGHGGGAIEWLPLSGPTDLPCFVHRYQNDPVLKVGFSVIASSQPLAGSRLPPNQQSLGIASPLSYEQARANLWGKVRMETPVLYFYASEQASVNVQVQFPRGLMTEWYPQAKVMQQVVSTAALRDPNRRSVIEWPLVTITPAAKDEFRNDVAESHYYAARATDAAPIDVNGQREKFLFYRGVADFDVPLTVEVLAQNAIRIRNLGAEPLPAVIVFENRGGRIGYRVVGAVQTEATVNPPTLNAGFDALRRDLEQLLVKSGLYAREATAMVDTWRDSWFEEGTRVFYVVPSAAVDRILPLRISPAPTSVARVFVGRMDAITPAMEQAVELALTSDSDDVIERFGRLLDPITDRILARSPGREMQIAIDGLRREAFMRYTTAMAKCR
jgi:hypothetical protein